jgi:hypothetical protein
MTNGILSGTQFANLTHQLVTACGLIYAEVDALLNAQPFTESGRVTALLARAGLLTAANTRAIDQCVAGDCFWQFALTADEAAALADPLA